MSKDEADTTFLEAKARVELLTKRLEESSTRSDEFTGHVFIICKNQSDMHKVLSYQGKGLLYETAKYCLPCCFDVEEFWEF